MFKENFIFMAFCSAHTCDYLLYLVVVCFAKKINFLRNYIFCYVNAMKKLFFVFVCISVFEIVLFFCKQNIFVMYWFMRRIFMPTRGNHIRLMSGILLRLLQPIKQNFLSEILLRLLCSIKQNFFVRNSPQTLVTNQEKFGPHSPQIVVLNLFSLRSKD